MNCPMVPVIRFGRFSGAKYLTHNDSFLAEYQGNCDFEVSIPPRDNVLPKREIS